MDNPYYGFSIRIILMHILQPDSKEEKEVAMKIKRAVAVPGLGSFYSQNVQSTHIHRVKPWSSVDQSQTNLVFFPSPIFSSLLTHSLKHDPPLIVLQCEKDQSPADQGFTCCISVCCKLDFVSFLNFLTVGALTQRSGEDLKKQINRIVSLIKKQDLPGKLYHLENHNILEFLQITRSLEILQFTKSRYVVSNLLKNN